MTMTESFFIISQFGHEFTLWILIVLSIFSLAFIFERWFSLHSLKKQNANTLEKINDCLKNNHLEDVVPLGAKKDSLGQAVSCGLDHIKNHGSNGLEEIFESYEIIEKQNLEKHLNFLATVGANAPFIGLLGTVFGIMDAFKHLAEKGDAASVMLGISHALVATAVGLLVAIPAVVAYNYFRQKVRAHIDSLERVRNLCLAFAKSQKKEKT